MCEAELWGKLGTRDFCLKALLKGAESIFSE